MLVLGAGGGGSPRKRNGSGLKLSSVLFLIDGPICELGTGCNALLQSENMNS